MHWMRSVKPTGFSCILGLVVRAGYGSKVALSVLRSISHNHHLSISLVKLCYSASLTAKIPGLLTEHVEKSLTEQAL